MRLSLCVLLAVTVVACSRSDTTNTSPPAALPVADHFDTSRVITLEGTVAGLMNPSPNAPHFYINLNVKNGRGDTERWLVEGKSRSALVKAGWTFGQGGTLARGNTVAMTAYDLKSTVGMKDALSDLPPPLQENVKVRARHRHHAPRREDRTVRRPVTSMDQRDPWWTWLRDLPRDGRYVLRTLARNPLFAGVAIFTLALGIGANSAIFSIVHAVVLQPPPYADPDQLVQIIEHVPAAETATGIPLRVSNLRLADVDALERHARTLAAIALYRAGTVTLTSITDVMVIQRAEVAPALFRLLRVSPLLGRPLRPADAQRGSPRVVVLSYGAWRTYFGGAANVLDRTVTMDGQEHAVVGVMPAGFAFPASDIVAWTPLPTETSMHGVRTYPAICRLRAGTSIEAAASEISVILSAARRLRLNASEPQRFTVSRLQDERAALLRPALRVLVVTVAFVLLIACSNVANLLLARAAAREQEIAVRAALGAGRGRLVRQVLTESIVLALAGGMVGLVLAVGGTRLLTATWPENIAARYVRGPADGPAAGTLDAIPLDGSVVAFTIVGSIGTGLLFGLVPALRIARMDVFAAIKEPAGSTSLARRTRAWISARSALIAVEIALATMLLVGAGLLIHSFIKLSNVNPGFNPEEVLTFDVITPNNASPRLLFNEQLVERLASARGVEAVGYAQQLPLQIGETSLPFRVLGRSNVSAEQEARALPVSYDYLRAIGVPLLAGRLLGAGDGAGGALVMMINEALAQQYFGRDSAVGRTVASIGATPWTIVGVVANVDFRQFSAAMGSPAAAAGSPLVGQLVRGASFAVRAAQPLSLVATVHAVVKQLDANASVSSVETMDERLSNSVARPRFYASFLGLLSGVAAALAAIGIYGLIAYSVAQRTREIGIRIAIGAERVDVLMLVLRDGFTLVMVGTAAGMAGALALTRYLSSLLFGLSQVDPATLALVFAAFVTVTLVAS